MAKRIVACTISTEAMLGSTCSIVMRHGPLPQARDARMKSREPMALAEARVTRAKVRAVALAVVEGIGAGAALVSLARVP